MSAKITLVEEKIEEIMDLLDIPRDKNSCETAHRISKMWCEEVFSSLYEDKESFMESLKVFPSPSRSPVTVKDIPFSSICAHHWLPFFGKVSVSYLPRENIIGLSKIPRVVKFCSKKPQVQENLTQEIGIMLVDVISPIWLEVRIYDTVHTCVLSRGIESQANTETVWRYDAPCR